MHASWKRNTALFLGSQALSLLGSSLVQYALLWQVTLQTRSSVMMTLYIVAGFLPTFILSPFAGVWADRYDRRKLIVLADAMIALVGDMTMQDELQAPKREPQVSLLNRLPKAWHTDFRNGVRSTQSR